MKKKSISKNGLKLFLEAFISVINRLNIKIGAGDGKRLQVPERRVAAGSAGGDADGAKRTRNKPKNESKQAGHETLKLSKRILTVSENTLAGIDRHREVAIRAQKELPDNRNENGHAGSDYILLSRNSSFSIE